MKNKAAMWIIKIHKNWKLTNLKEKLEFSEKKKTLTLFTFNKKLLKLTIIFLVSCHTA